MAVFKDRQNHFKREGSSLLPGSQAWTKAAAGIEGSFAGPFTQQLGKIDDRGAPGGTDVTLELRGKGVAPEPRLDVRPSDFLERSMFAQHDLAVLKFQRVGVARLGDGMRLRPFGELIKNRMQMRITEVAEISDLQTITRQRVGHDGAVAAELRELVDEFDVRWERAG